MTPGDFPRLPADRLARLLLECARQDPALVLREAPRTDPLLSDAFDTVWQIEALAPISLPSRPKSQADRHLEELVSIAVASAQNAADACRKVGDANGSAKRGVCALAGIAASAAVIGAACLVDYHIRNDTAGKLAQITDEVRALTALQHRTSVQLTALRSAEAVAEQREAVASAQQSAALAQAAPVTQTLFSATPRTSGPNPASPAYDTPLANHADYHMPTYAVSSYPVPPYPVPAYPVRSYPVASYPAAAHRSAPWPRYHPQPRRAAGSRPTGLATLIATVQRNIHLLFR